MDDYTKTVC